MELSLDIKQDVLDKTRKEAREEAISVYGEEDGKNSLYYPSLEFNPNGYYEYNSDKDVIEAGGDITTSSGENLGYMNIQLKLDFDMVINIIQAYMKKLGKLKTVLEATK